MEDKRDEMKRLLAFVTRNGEAKSYIQLRAYDVQDILVCKSLVLCSDYLKLCQKKDELFADKYISRCSVRYLDARRLDWRIVITATNRQAKLFDPDQMAAQAWRITYYDIADEIQATEVSDRIFKLQTVNLTMVNKNAVYSVLSAQMAGEAGGHFRVFCSIKNQYFSSSIVDADGRPERPPVKPSILLFEKAIQRDKEETERLKSLLRKEGWDE